MAWSVLMVIACVVTSSVSINRRVYKVVLTQKGYAQFLQYDVATPPLREFTFCAWIRIYDLANEQSIFTYVGTFAQTKELAPERGRVVRLWFGAAGRRMFMEIRGKVSSTVVGFVKNKWRHVCFSYQSDHGAWALYIDSQLQSCGAARSLVGYVVPGDGSVIFGYGASEDGAPNGLEGEIFGANMILASTIEGNYTVKNHPLYKQKYYAQNKLKDKSRNTKYLILNDLNIEELINNIKITELPSLRKTESYISIKTPRKFIKHDLGIDLISRKPKNEDLKKVKENFDFYFNPTVQTKNNKNISLWRLTNKTGEDQKQKTISKNREQLSSRKQLKAETQNLATVSKYGTPPPIKSRDYFHLKSLEIPKLSKISETNFGHNNVNENMASLKKKTNRLHVDLIKIETPPAIKKKTNIAGSVLNYLKSINYYTKEQKKLPTAVQLAKISELFPYSSDFKVVNFRPSMQLQRRNFTETRFKRPVINMKALKNDSKKDILKMQMQPKYVEITNRGQNNRRFYRNAESQSFSYQHAKYNENNTNNTSKMVNPVRFYRNVDDQNNYNLLTILPFFKSVEYFLEDTEDTPLENNTYSNDMYLHKLLNRNKWHHINAHNSEHKLRRITAASNDINSDSVTTEVYERLTTFSAQTHKCDKQSEDQMIVKARKLAMEVSKKSESSTNIRDSLPLFKYNHGYLPAHDEKMKTLELINSAFKPNAMKNVFSANIDFNKPVKVGSTLNERFMMNKIVDQNKRSFIGDYENVPDINKYRSDIDKVNENVPSSLGSRTCMSDLHERVLYVQPDQSIDMSNIISPIKTKNIAIQFVLENYKRCSLEESILERSPFLFIHWSKTPVRLFGGAHPKKTKDLCGFF